MALTAIEAQAVSLFPNSVATPYTRFNDGDGCDTSTYYVPVERTDTHCVQVLSGEVTGTNLVTDGTFDTVCGVNWTCGADWSIAAGVATKAATGNTELVQDVGIQENRFYKITATISNLSGGNAVITTGGEAASLTADGTHTWYIETMSAWTTDTDITFKGNVSAATYDVDDVTVVEMSALGYRIINETDGSLVYETYDSAEIKMGGSEGSQRSSAHIELCIDWTQATDDECYYIEIVDISVQELITNGTFDSGASWTLGTEWSIAAGVATCAVVGVQTELNRTMSQTVTIPKGSQYTLTFDMSNYTSGSLDIKTDVGTHQTGINSNGAKTVTIDLSAASSDATVIKFVGSDIAAGFDIDNVSIIEDITEKPAVLVSESFCVADTHANTKLFTWTNDDNFTVNSTFIDYTNFTYTQSFRETCKTWKPTYPSERSIYRFSNGSRQLNFARTDKVVQLTTPFLPEYVHDFFSAAFAHDEFKVDGTEYLRPDDGTADYDPDWRRDGNLNNRKGSVELEIVQDGFIRKNSNC